MKEAHVKKHVEWYAKNRQLYELLCGKVKDIIIDIFEDHAINYSKIECRAKSIESFKNKLEKGISYNPREMQDLAGIRVIGYVHSDLEEIRVIIEQSFEVKKNYNNSEDLGTDKVGYRSDHFVVTFPQERVKLPEYRKFEGICFEIQLRTILEHAWAEIQHDKNYKFSGVLPEEVKRRFSLLAGVLELADYEFDNINKFLEDYSKQVQEKTKVGSLDIPINSTSLNEFMLEEFGMLSVVDHSFGEREVSAEVIDELCILGISTLADLKKLIPQNYKQMIEDCKINDTFAGIVRDLLIINFKDDYFRKAWNGRWNSTEKNILNVWKNFGVSNIEDILDEYRIDVYDEAFNEYNFDE